MMKQYDNTFMMRLKLIYLDLTIIVIFLKIQRNFGGDIQEFNKKNLKPKIVGGEIVKNQTEFNYEVSIKLHGKHICGGSILTKKHILSAAHCFFNNFFKLLPSSQFSITAGSLNIKNQTNITKNIETILLHEGYNPEKVINDLAIIKISEFFEFSREVNFIQLADDTPKYINCTVSGWGVTKFNTSEISYDLRSVEVPIVPKRRCREYYGNYVNYKVFCAGGNGKDSCQGDSGGPLVCGGKLSGVVSWGDGCADLPGVYTDVSQYKYWIFKQLYKNKSSIKKSSKLYFLIVILIQLCK